jgi:predicted transcriptional regulator
MTKSKQASTKTKKLPKDITLSISVDPELRQAIDERAKKDDRSSSYIARKAIEQYLGIEGTA